MRLFRLILSCLVLSAALAGCGAPVVTTAQTDRLGTAWGEDVTSKLGRGDFDRIGRQPLAVEVLAYSAAPLSGQRVPELRMASDRLTLRVLRENGRAWPMTMQNGRGQVQGTRGERYVLEYTNRSNRDIFEIVTTVDGLDVVNGQPGNLRNRGHVLRPGQSVRIAGFRKNAGEVAAFRFADVADSYATKSARGSGDNAGVIGTAVFRLAEPNPLDCRTPPCAFGGGAVDGKGFAPPPGG